jgi:DNA polymerase III delta prime subunit
MSSLQEVFDRIQQSKKEQRVIRNTYRDALSANGSYHEAMEKLRGYKLRKSQIEDRVKEDMGQEYRRLEDLAFDIKSDQELLSDISINQLTKGEEVAVTDEESNRYEPLFSVRFKKKR